MRNIAVCLIEFYNQAKKSRPVYSYSYQRAKLCPGWFYRSQDSWTGNSCVDTVLLKRKLGESQILYITNLSRFIRKTVICAVYLMFEIKN